VEFEVEPEVFADAGEGSGTTTELRGNTHEVMTTGLGLV
jgi:hypothetical protein